MHLESKPFETMPFVRMPFDNMPFENIPFENIPFEKTLRGLPRPGTQFDLRARCIHSV
jgi:hypothetical protein